MADISLGYLKVYMENGVIAFVKVFFVPCASLTDKNGRSILKAI